MRSSFTIPLAVFIMIIVAASAFLPLEVLSPVTVCLIGIVIGAAIIGFIGEPGERTFLVKVFFWTYAVRIILAVLLHLASSGWDRNPGFFVDDGWGYSENGWTIAKRMAQGLPISFTIVKVMSVSGAITAYDYFNGFVYNIVGKSPMTMFFLNSFVGAVTVIFVYLIAKDMFDVEVAKLAAIISAFWPSMILWSTQNLKDPMTGLFTVVFFWCVMGFLRGRNVFYLPVAAISLHWLMLLRSPIGKLAIFSIAAYLCFLGYKKTKRYRLLFLPLVLLAVFMLFKMYNIQERLTAFFMGPDSILSGAIQEMDYYRKIRASARLAIMPAYEIKNFASLLMYMPIGCMASLFGPFPWQLFSLSQITAAPEMLVWYCVFPYAVAGLAAVLKRKLYIVLPMVLFVAAVLLLMAAVEGNMGTIFRHRSVVMNFLLIFMAAGIVKARKKGAY